MSVPSPVPRRQRLEHDERRRQILDCARTLFSERSYDTVSTAEIASAAGVARGLLNHYFGTKRELYLEVVRTLLRVPPGPTPVHRRDQPLEQVLEEGVVRWLDLLERNRGTWLAAVGTQGLGRDPEVAAILGESRERIATRLIGALGQEVAGHPADVLRAAMRSYGGLAEAASVEWLQRGRLTREQVHVLLVGSLLAIVRDVLPDVAEG